MFASRGSMILSKSKLHAILRIVSQIVQLKHALLPKNKISLLPKLSLKVAIFDTSSSSTGSTLLCTWLNSLK